MNRLVFFSIPMIFTVSSLFAATKTVSTDLTPFIGYRQDNLKWTSKDGSSFKWNNLRFIDYGGKGKTTFKNRYILIYEIGLANVLSGTLQDNQYLIPGAPSSSSSFNGFGMAFRPNLGVGYKFKPNRWFNISPQLGYSYDLIYLNNNRNSGPFSSVKDTIQWHGPWAGFDATFKIKRLSLNFAGFYNVAFYRNNGDWKVSPSPVKNTFSQSGTGQGVTGRIGIGYEVVKSITLGANAGILNRRVKNASDSRTIGGASPNKTKLRTVNWTSFDTNLTLTKTF